MYSLVNQINQDYVKNGDLIVYWLGQAGFIFKTDSGTKIGVDLYFSDCCNRYFGFKRLMPMLVSPHELDLDILITTHAHYDHFDVDSVPIMMKSKTMLIGANDCINECERLGIDLAKTKFLAPGDSVQIMDVTINAEKCDHGKETPDAIGVLLEGSGKRVYITGDTSYRPDFLTEDLCGTDLLILPINGAFGNLDEKEAAQYANLLKAKCTIPCHYWNFAEHGGNPYMFMENMRYTNPELKYHIMRMGEYIVL